jgi:hypothetical protein
MSKMKMPQPLGVVLYWAFHLKLGQFTGFSAKRVRAIREGDLREIMPKIMNALSWAVAHPEADFAGVFPEMGYTSKQLYEYLKIVHRQLSEAEAQTSEA